jgi:hypothetical protein
MAFSDKLRDMVNTGMAASRDIMSKAASQAQTWGEMGVLKVEIVQYRSQAEKLTTKLGAEAYAAFAERKDPSLSANAPTVSDLVGRIAELGRLIDEKEAAYRKLGGKDSDLD